MRAEDLQQVRPGFHDTALGSQAVFRAALNALSHPGRAHAMPPVAELPLHGFGAAAALLLALVDSDCAVWLSPSIAHTDAAAWLRFHTGCGRAANPAAARFLWIAQGDALPVLSALALGSDEYPDLSATAVIEVLSLGGDLDQGACELRLQGPGIALTETVSVNGLPDDFSAQWAANHGVFPRGVDLFLATPTHIAGLPRSTRIRAPQEV